MSDDDRNVQVITVNSQKNGMAPNYKSDENVPATFEEAVTETKFGKLNLLLIACAMPVIFSPIFETTTMSYVFVAAQCDLHLSLQHKGLLNSITYAGMISSGIMWGFLFDVLGRRKLLTIGLFLSSIVVLCSAFANSLTFLLVFKFLGGFIVNGPFSAVSSYLCEFHASKYRSTLLMIIGTINALGCVILPALAWLILPQNINLSFFNNAITLHSWNIYLMTTACPALLSGVIFIFLPESPKYLMTCGKNEKALDVFQWVYSVNTGKSKESYPIKVLVDETKINENNKNGGHVTRNRSSLQALKEGFQQIKPMFCRPYSAHISLVCIMAMCIIMSYNTLRLWFPQIFQAAEDYALLNNGNSASLCVTLDEAIPKNESIQDCAINMENKSVYISSIINSSIMMVGLLLSGAIIRFTGKKRLLFSACLLAGVCSFGLYFSQNRTTTTVLTSLFTAFGTISTNIIASVCVEMFPTTLRTLSVALAFMVGRMGATSGNLLFPYLLRAGCGPPFAVAGGCMLGAAMISLLLPNTENKAMQ